MHAERQTTILSSHAMPREGRHQCKNIDLITQYVTANLAKVSKNNNPDLLFPYN
jgi:hypothetical protein